MNTGPHRVTLSEHQFNLSGYHWSVRVLLKIGLVILPVVLIAGIIAMLAALLRLMG